MTVLRALNYKSVTLMLEILFCSTFRFSGYSVFDLSSRCCSLDEKRLGPKLPEFITFDSFLSFYNISEFFNAVSHVFDVSLR